MHWRQASWLLRSVGLKRQRPRGGQVPSQAREGVAWCGCRSSRTPDAGLRQHDLEVGAEAWRAASGDGAAVGFDDRFGDAEAEARPALGAGAAGIDPVEPVEQARDVLRGDAVTGVGNPDPDSALPYTAGWAGRGAQPRVTLPPRGVWLRALSTRLTSTCRMRSSSATTVQGRTSATISTPAASAVLKNCSRTRSISSTTSISPFQFQGAGVGAGQLQQGADEAGEALQVGLQAGQGGLVLGGGARPSEGEVDLGAHQAEGVLAGSEVTTAHRACRDVRSPGWEASPGAGCGGFDSPTCLFASSAMSLAQPGQLASGKRSSLPDDLPRNELNRWSLGSPAVQQVER